LHVIEGTGRKDRHTAAALASAEHDDTPIAIPPHLSKGARDAWAYLVPVLQRMGVLMPDADELALSRLCECWAEIQELDAQLRVTGPTYETRSVKDGLMVRAYPQVAMRRR
jgi:P27 family predicted phage terminase small subunit